MKKEVSLLDYFELHSPCGNCPFLKEDGCRLYVERITEIAEPFTREGEDHSFICHKTKDKRKVNQRHCAGALIFAEKQGHQTQWMQIANRLGMYDPEKLKGHERVAGSLQELIQLSLNFGDRK